MESVAKSFLSVAVLERIEKEKALCAENHGVFVFVRFPGFGYDPKRATDRCDAKGRSFDGFVPERGGKRGERRKRRILLVEAGILSVAEPACGQGRRGRAELRRASTEINHHGIERSEFRGNRFAFLAQKIGVKRPATGEASRHHRTFHNPELLSIFGPGSKGCVIPLDGAGKRFRRLLQAGGLHAGAAPEIDFFFSSAEPRFRVAAGDYKGIAVFRTLDGAEGDLAAAARRLYRMAASVSEKAFWNAHNQIPFVRRNAARGKQPARRQKLWLPTLRGKEKCIRDKAETGLAGRSRLEFRRKVQGMAHRDLPRPGEVQRGISGIVR